MGTWGIPGASASRSTALVREKLPVTLQLGVMAFAFALLIGVPAGVLSAVKRGTWWDHGANLIGLGGLSTPNFWLGIMLILLVSVQLGWLPPSGYVPLSVDFWQSLATTIMPAFVLGNATAAVLMRHTRSAMLTALDQDYVRTARAKGLAEGRVVIPPRAAQRAGSRRDPRRPRTRHPVLRRGAEPSRCSASPASASWWWTPCSTGTTRSSKAS